MNTNKNSSNYNGEKNVEATECSSSNTANQKTHRIRNILSEEKKQDIREKKKLRMQKYRSNLSEEQKQQMREKERLKRQQQRANLSDEDRVDLNQRVRHRRANLSDKEKSMQKGKNALQHRNKYHHEKLLVQSHHLNRTRAEDKNGVDNEEDDDDDDDDEDDDDDNQGEVINKEEVAVAVAYREKRYAQSRIYKKARYAQLKDAETKLKTIAQENSKCDNNDDDVEQLQLFANRRKQMLEYARMYRQTHPLNRSWVPIQQAWDEDNPCK